MAMYEWDEKFSVNVIEIDRHHQKLFELMNSLHEACKGGDADAAVFPIMKRLSEYTIYHFEKEEEMMAKANYVDLPAHKVAHKAFIATIDDFIEEAEKPGMAIFVVSKVMSTGVAWLKEHILGMDKKYSQAMNVSGIR